jgi:hypothetical protein
MTIGRVTRIMAGTFVLASLALAWWVSEWFLLFTAFVGLNLLQSGITNWCLMDDILKALGVPGECDGERKEDDALQTHS